MVVCPLSPISSTLSSPPAGSPREELELAGEEGRKANGSHCAIPRRPPFSGPDILAAVSTKNVFDSCDSTSGHPEIRYVFCVHLLCPPSLRKGRRHQAGKLKTAGSTTNTIVHTIGKRLFSRTGQHMYCLDKDGQGRCLLEIMADPSELFLRFTIKPMAISTEGRSNLCQSIVPVSEDFDRRKWVSHLHLSLLFALGRR